MVKYLLHLQVEKTEVFTWTGVLPPEAPTSMKLAGVVVDDLFLPGMMVYGIPVGTDQYVRHMLDEVVENIPSEVSKVEELLQGDSQAMWAILNSSLAHKLDWHLTLCYPSDMKEAATKLDSKLWSMLEKISRCSIPRVVDQHQRGAYSADCVLQVPNVDWANGHSFQQLLVPQPIKLGGFGLRSLVETSPAAYVGGVEMTLPHFTGEGGICPLLQDVVGLVSGTERWSSFLSAKSRTAQEFQTSWVSMQSECLQNAAYLGTDLGLPMSLVVEKAGESSLDRSTRRKLVQQREGLRQEVLAKALKEHNDRFARPVTVYPNFDKLSGAWLLSLPGPNTGIPTALFCEAMAAHLCLKSPK